MIFFGTMELILLISGCIVFPMMFYLQQYFWVWTPTGRKVAKHYGFSYKDCSDISCKIVSGIQAILASIAGAIVCSNCYENVLYNSHPMTMDYAWFGIPYFVYDTFAMFYVSRLANNTTIKTRNGIATEFFKFIIKSPVIVIHHMILAPLGFSLISFFRDGVRNGDFFVGIVYLMEVSTPFVSLRFILSKFKLKSSIVYTINGVAMLILFPIFRIISTFWTIGLYSKQNGLGYLETIVNIPLGWKIIFFLAIAPQIYWYFLMWNGLVKMIKKSQGDKQQLIDETDEKPFLNNTIKMDNGVSSKLGKGE